MQYKPQDSDKLYFAEADFRAYNFRKQRAEAIYWKLYEATQRLYSGGRSLSDFDPDRVPQKHKIGTGSGRDIIGLIDKKDKLETQYKDALKENSHIDYWLQSLPDEELATMIRERYIDGLTFEAIETRHSIPEATVRRWIKSAMIAYADTFLLDLN